MRQKRSRRKLKDVPEAPWMRGKEKPEETKVEVKPETTIKQRPPKLRPTARKPTTNTPAGRRPDYTHALIGLEPGDELQFVKHPIIMARVVDHTFGIEIKGKVYPGIIAGAAAAYSHANIVSPMRITGLAEWKVMKSGLTIKQHYNQINPIPKSAKP